MPNEIAMSENAQVQSKKLVDSGKLVIELMNLKIKLEGYERRISKLESNPQENLVSSSEDECYVVVGEGSDTKSDDIVFHTLKTEASLKHAIKKRKGMIEDGGNYSKYRIARLVFLDEGKDLYSIAEASLNDLREEIKQLKAELQGKK